MRRVIKSRKHVELSCKVVHVLNKVLHSSHPVELRARMDVTAGVILLNIVLDDLLSKKVGKGEGCIVAAGKKDTIEKIVYTQDFTWAEQC